MPETGEEMKTERVLREVCLQMEILSFILAGEEKDPKIRIELSKRSMAFNKLGKKMESCQKQEKK
jgi:hypothetical protein